MSKFFDKNNINYYNQPINVRVGKRAPIMTQCDYLKIKTFIVEFGEHNCTDMCFFPATLEKIVYLYTKYCVNFVESKLVYFFCNTITVKDLLNHLRGVK